MEFTAQTPLLHSWISRVLVTEKGSHKGLSSLTSYQPEARVTHTYVVAACGIRLLQCHSTKHLYLSIMLTILLLSTLPPTLAGVMAYLSLAGTTLGPHPLSSSPPLCRGATPNPALPGVPINLLAHRSPEYQPPLQGRPSGPACRGVLFPPPCSPHPQPPLHPLRPPAPCF